MSTTAFQLLKRALVIAGDELELAEVSYHPWVMWYLGLGLPNASPFEAQRLWLQAAAVHCFLFCPCVEVSICNGCVKRQFAQEGFDECVG